MKTVFYLCAGIILALAGCKSQKAALAFSDLNGEWHIAELNGNKLAAEETKQRMLFDAAGRKLSGNAGCNQFAGEVEVLKGGNIRFRRIISTRKACMDMRLENELLRALNEVTHFGAANETVPSVAFYDTNRKKLFVIEKPAN